MAGLKRKEAPKTGTVKASLPQKKQKTVAAKAPAHKTKKPVDSDLSESDTTEDEDDFDGLSSDGGAALDGDESTSDIDSAPETGKPAKSNGSAVNGASDGEGEKKIKSTITCPYIQTLF